MTAPQRRASDPTPEMARARARYETFKTMLVGLLVGVVLASLALLVAQSVTIRNNQKQLAQLAEENKAEAAVVADLLARQTEADRTRQQVINQAVAQIAAEQRRALVAHDESVKDYLRRALGLLDEEVNSPMNRERVIPPALRLPAPAPAPKPGAVAPPKAAPKAAPAPRPAPAPTPPCEKRGNSRKCRR